LTDCCDLPVWLQEQVSADEDVAALARCVSDRVSHMHDCGLYHGDLNVKNILVSRTDVRQFFIILTGTRQRIGRMRCIWMTARRMRFGSAASRGITHTRHPP